MGNLILHVHQSKAGRPFLSFVVPAYNEEKRISKSLHQLITYISQVPWSIEVLVVIERSQDRTLEVVKKIVGAHPAFRIFENDVQRGKGYAVKTGMLQARGEIVFFMDADLSTPLKEIEKFVEEFAAQPELMVAVGSRRHPDSELMKKQSWLRRNMGSVFNKIVQSFAIRGIEDTQCGFKAFRREAIVPVFSRQSIDGFAFDVEILLLAQVLGFSMKTFPVCWENSKDSKVRIVRDSWDMLKTVLRLKSKINKIFLNESNVDSGSNSANAYSLSEIDSHKKSA